jgi:hypothetical protein
MLTITEESAKYPPAGKIPNLEDNDDASVYMLGKFQLLTAKNDKLDPALGTLVTWSSDRGVHTFATWADAATAALASELAVRDQSAQRSTVTGTSARTGTDDKLNVMMSKQSSEEVQALKFGNCGQTAAAVLDLLEQHVSELHDMRRDETSKPGRFDAGNREALRAPLTSVPADGNILLVDCSFQDVHTFLLEVHPDGRRYLVQGYQGGYLASWWQGTDPAGLALTRPTHKNDPVAARKYQDAATAVTGIQSRYGGGKPIALTDMAEFVDHLVAAFADGTWATFAQVWLKLPFCPTSDESASIILRGSSPRIQVTSYEIKNPGITDGSLCGSVIPPRVSDFVKIAQEPTEQKV